MLSKDDYRKIAENLLNLKLRFRQDYYDTRSREFKELYSVEIKNLSKLVEKVRQEYES